MTIYNIICFPSFNTISKIVYCIEPGTNMPTTIHICHVWHIFLRYIWDVCAICMSLVWTMWPGILYTHFANYISCYWHILLHKYGCHIANKDHTALILDGHLDLTMAHICTQGESTTTSTDLQALITFFVNYISCPWHISLNIDIG